MRLQGELTMRTTPTLIPHAGELIASGDVDLADVSNADSAGAAFLLELKRRASAAQKPLRFINCPAQLKGLIHFFELEDALEIGVSA